MQSSESTAARTNVIPTGETQCYRTCLQQRHDMADHVRRLSTEKNVAQVHSFHSFIRSTDADDKSKVATLYDDWTSYDEVELTVK